MYFILIIQPAMGHIICYVGFYCLKCRACTELHEIVSGLCLFVLLFYFLDYYGKTMAVKKEQSNLSTSGEGQSLSEGGGASANSTNCRDWAKKNENYSN